MSKSYCSKFFLTYTVPKIINTESKIVNCQGYMRYISLQVHESYSIAHLFRILETLKVETLRKYFYCLLLAILVSRVSLSGSTGFEDDC